MADPNEPRLLVHRARALGRRLLQIYETEAEETPPDLLDLLDIAQSRLEAAGYQMVEIGDDADPSRRAAPRKN